MPSTVVAVIVSSAALWALYLVAPRLGLMDHPGERRKLHSHSVPPIGGLAIFIAIVTALVIQGEHSGIVVAGMLGAALLVAVGALDDRIGLGCRARFVAQVFAALILVIGAGAQLHELGDLFGLGAVQLGAFGIPFSIFAIVGIVNAFNMIDGIDGLAGGLALVVLLSVIGAFSVHGGGATAGLLPLVVIAILPYMVCNLQLLGCRGKRVFLGDSGSMLLGYIVAWALVDASQAQGAISPVAAIWLVAVPLMDTLYVMGRRMVRRESPFKADRGHLHHVLTRMTRSQRVALIGILLLSASLAAWAFFADASGVGEPLMFYTALLVFACYLMLRTRAIAIYRWLHRDRRRRRLNAELA